MKTRFAPTAFAVAAFVAGLALSPWLVYAFTRADPPRPTEVPHKPGRLDAVAVLPFAAPAGLHDAVTWHVDSWPRLVPGLLLDDSTLRVARPSQVAKWHGQDPLWAGKQLQVGAVLTGSVRAEDDGARLVIEAELLEVETGLLLWTKRWEEDDLAKKIDTLERIRGELAQGVKKRLQR